MDENTLTARITEAIKDVTTAETEFLREELTQVQQQLTALRLEDKGWTSLFGGNADEDQGLTLDQVKEWSKILREMVAGSPLPKQANALRYSYTFSHPFVIPGVEALGTTEKRGRPSRLPKINDFYHDPVNQRYVFGKEAQELISTACSTDSVYLALGDDKTREIRAIPISEIADVMVDPDFPGEIWAYLRAWTHYSNGQSEVKKRWYYTDRFRGKRSPSILSGSDLIEVDQDKTIIDFVVNQQAGWTFGVADLQAGHVWNKKYVTMMNHGEEVSAAMAHFAMVVKAQSKTGAERIGVKVAGDRQSAGNTAIIGQGNELSALTSSKSAYDFASLRDVAGMYALSIGVSVVDLLASPAASGSSYGSAQSLHPAMRRGIEARRAQVAAWMERVIEWGTGERIEVTPASIEEVEPYRREQMLTMAWNSGLLHEDEVRPQYLYLTGTTPKHDKAPEGVLLPNNKKSLPRKDIDKDGQGVPPTAAAPNQGKPDGTGGAGSAASKDIRDDLVT